MTADVLLRVDRLSTWIASGETPLRVVDDVSFDIRRGETFALVGESGCGKSMTALSIVRLLPESAGIVGGGVHLAGQDLTRLPERAMRDVRGRRIAMIFQESATSLNPVLTVGAQVEEVLLRHRGLGRAEARSRVVALFESVGIPDAARRADEYPFQLSGGLRQRVMIAMALACEPELLVADEPTTALDVTIQAQVLDVLADVQRRTGMAMLLITHDLAVVARMASRVAVMYAGQIVETAPVHAFLRRPAHPYARMLLRALPDGRGRASQLANIPGSIPDLRRVFDGCRFADRCDRADDLCAASAPRLERTDPTREVRCVRPESAPDASRSVAGSPMHVIDRPVSSDGAAPLLEVQALQVHFPIRRGPFKRTVGHVRAVDGVDLELRAGRTLALVGESGCGKTTVGRSIVRLLPPTGGRIVFEGRDLATVASNALVPMRRGFQMVFQDPFSSLDPRMRVREILEEGLLALRPDLDRAGRDRHIDGLLDRVGLGVEAKLRYPHEFSGGQRQRIAIARALAVEPKVLVCDEPTSALDVSVQAQILNLLRELQQELGLAYLFITHNLAVVSYLADEVAVMYLGRIVEQGPVAAVMTSPAHPYTRALLSSVPRLDGARDDRTRLEGDPPSPAAPPAGCHFHPRCPIATAACREAYPEPREAGPEHRVRCIAV